MIKNKSFFVPLFLLTSFFCTLQAPTAQELYIRAQQLQEKQQYNRAIPFYHAACKKDQNNLPLLSSLAYCYLATDEYKKAQIIYEKLAHILPNNPDILCNLGLVLKRQNKMHEAITIYKKALDTIKKANKKNYDKKMMRISIKTGISGAYLALGNFAHGWSAYEYRWVNPPYYIHCFKQYRKRSNNNFKNKRILIKTEYGLGDTLQFIRYLPFLKKKGAYIMVESQPELATLLKQCWYIDEIIPPKMEKRYDLCTLLMSMPFIMDTTAKTIPTPIPYLFADEKLINYWHKKIADDHNFKVGLCWQAQKHAENENLLIRKSAEQKSIPLHKLAPLAEAPNISFYSLQKIHGTDQLHNLPNNFAIHHFDNMDTKNGRFMDTAALIKNLDLVITIDTSIAHLAGGLGVPVWLLLPHHADWRWFLDRNDSPWYPSMRLFRQPQPGNWHAVIQNVKTALQKIVV